MFDENSGLVKVWVRILSQENSKFTIDSVPNISNLKEIIKGLI